METVRRMQNKLGKPSKPSSASAKCRHPGLASPRPFPRYFLETELKNPSVVAPGPHREVSSHRQSQVGDAALSFIIYLLIKRPVIRQIYMQIHTQLCRLGGASAAGNLNKQHHQVALREIDVWKHPGRLQADLAIPPLSSSNPPSREGPQPLLAKSKSKIIRESFNGSKTHPEKVLRENFRSASLPPRHERLLHPVLSIADSSAYPSSNYMV